jgi:hypothetical protein
MIVDSDIPAIATIAGITSPSPIASITTITAHCRLTGTRIDA